MAQQGAATRPPVWSPMRVITHDEGEVGEVGHVADYIALICDSTRRRGALILSACNDPRTTGSLCCFLETQSAN